LRASSSATSVRRRAGAQPSFVSRPGRAETRDELAALDLFEKLGDQEVSYTDCVSFALMRQAGIGRAFSFDRHFDLLGFERLPR
jgi:predicted nucleic acid-binding protein